MSKLTASQLAYIKQVEVFGYDLGLAPSFARVMGWLLICQPDHQSAEDIQKTLRLSVGSVNNAVNVLVKTGLVEKLTFPGDRRFYYRLRPASWRAVFEGRVRAVRSARVLAEQGLALDPNNSRLIEMHKFYAWAEDAFAKMLQQPES